MANPIRHFKHNETSGTTMIDSSDSATNGTYDNASILNANGKISRCIYPNTLYNGIFNLGAEKTAWTIAFWFKPDTTPATLRTLVNNAADDIGIQYFTSSSFRIEGAASHTFNTAGMSNGVWYHLIVTHSAAGDLNLYFNNTASAQNPANDAGSTLPNADMKIGLDHNTSSYDWDGFIDDFRVYDSVIDSDERDRIYNSGTGTETTNSGPTAPTVTTQAVSDIETTTATGNGNITNTGGENCDKRGIVYDLAAHGNPGNTAPADSNYSDYEEETDGFGTGAFTRSLTGLNPGTKYYARAYAHNSESYSYGDEIDFTLLPIEDNYVENKRKELKTKYKADTPELGREMGLRPQGLLGVKSQVPRKERKGIG